MDEWEEAHEASALHCGFDGALLLGREARALLAHHTAVRIHELLQEVHVFVVDVPDIILCKYICAHSFMFCI